jgi:hypothetical protein
MKMSQGIELAARAVAARFLFPAIVVAAVARCVSAADVQDPGAFRTDVSRSKVTTLPAYTVEEPLASKTHTLFMGADISVGLDKTLHPVKDVVGSSWVIDVKGETTVVSTKSGPVNMKVTPVVKLTEALVTVDNLRDERAYSFNNDPLTLQTRAMVQTAATNADYIYNANQAAAVVDGTTALVQYATMYNMKNPDAHVGGVGPDMTRLNTMISQANENQIHQLSGGGSSLEIGGKKTVPDGLDAMEVTFVVSSRKLLSNPYVVTITRFHAKGDSPGTSRNWVYAKALNPIDDHMREVHFTVEGFPPDFELQDFQMHVYNRGEEVATTVAQDRVGLTRDEAFEYLKMEYVGAHPKDTLPAVPAMAKLPADLHSRLSGGEYRDTYFVRVSKDGMGGEAFRDAACTQRIDDPYLESVVKNIRFNPALNNGKPVDGVASINLGQLPI